ncbi:hypothetical protein NCU02574 [Neurospora crassa OR74A]|uniref:Uncharacterized protein n=1 Tax=Neurospora crassa (strain ATCC 24698 / 74-OR23-1A / CBS 708.71 / DSM 1257 / FGSC 987) TaxID=367110 RepID=Q1K955_NEUCR|nr:hypothetical protein NCU02574 [Neurospora crassa OR74A]EAA36469.1 hypothetical protein NCU02574 [Neurospora crassa OR74A]|eukprot:XP_965705.1 hypothetical protein NCU02574 [Neurospora crassa OR74A]
MTDPYGCIREAVPSERQKRVLVGCSLVGKRVSGSGEGDSALASLAPATPAQAVVMWCILLGCPIAFGGPKVVMLQPLKVPFSEMFLQRAWNRIKDPRKVRIWLGDVKP